MPTIKQLPTATSVNATDVLPISQGTTTRALTVGQLLSSTQAALSLASGKLLGRVSGLAGGPEPVSVGAGLTLDTGLLSATGSDHPTLPVSTVLGASDEVVVNSSGTARRMAATLLRGLFSAGPGVTIDNGTISAASPAYALPPATTAALGGVKVDGSSILVDGTGLISAGPAATIALPAVLGAAGAPAPISASGATFTLQNGNIGAADVPLSPAAFDGVRSVLALTPGSSVGQVSALGGYAVNRAAFVAATNRNAVAALFGQSVADVDGARSWGLALNVNDGAGGGTGTGAGRVLTNEIDVGVTRPQTVASGLTVSAAFTVQPGGADGFVVATAGSAGNAAAARWVNGVSVRAGSATTAVRIGAAAGVGARGSMPVVLEGADATGATVSATIKADGAGNAVIAGADILLQATGLARVNGAPLLTSAAVPSAGGLLATSGTAGAAQPATAGQFEALMTAWLLSKATAPAVTPGWWNNSGNPTYS